MPLLGVATFDDMTSAESDERALERRRGGDRTTTSSLGALSAGEMEVTSRARALSEAGDEIVVGDANFL